MNILLVEDDCEQADFLHDALRRAFEDVHVERAGSVSELAAAMPRLASNPPDIAIIDYMLPIDEESPAPVPQNEAVGTDVFTASGPRCIALLRGHQPTGGVPVILFTVLDRGEIDPVPEGVVYMRKDASETYLIRTVRSLLSAKGKLRAKPANAARSSVFISYAHEDRKFLDDLLKHLQPLQRAGRIRAWSDRQIAPGSKWFEEIQAGLATARVAVLLVSKDFLASDFVHEHELGPLLRKAEQGGVTILWFLVRACRFKDSPINKYQAVIPPDKPLAQMKAERDAAWVQIGDEIVRALDGPSSACRV